MYKLIAFDFDGTLIDSGQEMDETILSTLKNWIEEGRKIIIASGRNYRSLKNIFGKYDLPIDVIANNGNTMRCILDDSIQIQKPIHKEILEKILPYIESLPYHATFHIDDFKNGVDMYLLEEPDEITKNYVQNYQNRYKIINKEEIFQKDVLSVVMYMNYEEYIRVKKELSFLTKGLETHHIAKGISHTGMMEVLGQNTNKWNTIYEYAQSYGISREEIIAVGDDRNDMKMIQNAGVGIAMCNSPEEVKKVANYITYDVAKNYGAISFVKEIIERE